jgi:protein SCO1/2
MSFRSWGIWAPIIVAAGVAGAWLAHELREPPVLVAGTWLEPSHEIAGFALTDDHGRDFGLTQLRGAPVLMFFGFTNCPDVCPATLATLADVLRRKPVPGLRVILVTVDPERDSPLALNRYLKAFGQDFIGLTGAASALAPLHRELHVASEPERLPDGSYTMNHSTAVYLIDGRGRFVAVFTPPFTSAQLAGDLASLRTRIGA